MSTIGIVIDQKCNIRCAHCCFSSGPNSTAHLSDDAVLRIAEDAANNSEVDTIALSGGEALLRFNLILQCANIAQNHDKQCTVMTNGFWGVTQQIAERKVAMMKSNGVSSLGFSIDDFHERFINVNRIKNCLEACTGGGMKCSIDMVVTEQHPGTELIRQLGESVLGIPIFRYPLQKVGRAVALEDASYRIHTANDSLRCPGFQVTYHFDGKVYPCCAPSAFHPAYSLGSYKDLSVSSALRRVKFNHLFAILRYKGLTWLLDSAREANVPHLPTGPFVNACELCGLLFSNPAFLDWLKTYCGEIQ